MAETTLTKKDFQTDQEVRWCPGCGDYAILSSAQQTFADLGLERHNMVIVSGMGCAARFPYYVNTYGFHTVHGRAPAVNCCQRLLLCSVSSWKLVAIPKQPPGLAQQPVYLGSRRFRAEAAHQVVVDGHYRSLSTGPQAGVEAERHQAIGSVAFTFQTYGSQYLLYYRHGAHQMAGGAPADFHVVGAQWFEAKVGIKGGHSPNIVDRGAYEGRDLFHSFFGHVAKLIVDGQ